MSDSLIFDGDKRELDKYIRAMADMMGLRDWTLRVDIEHGVEVDNHRFHHGTAAAAARVTHGRQSVVITLDAGWPEWDADTLRQTVAHELVHCHTARMLYAFYNVQNVVTGTLFDVMDSAFDDAHELAVDAIATAWAETLPLPVRGDAEEAA